MSKFINIGYYIFVLGVLTLGVLLMLLQTSLLNGYEVKIVQSGSMESVLKTGGVILVKKLPAYNVSDIITFVTANSDTPTTHRIIATELIEGKLHFTTKGDANDSADVGNITVDQVIGKTIFHVPYLGFLLDFARQPLGFVLLIVLPALVVISEETVNIVRSFRGKQKIV